MSFSEAFGDGHVRFTTNFGDITLEGTRKAIENSLPVWWRTAGTSKDVFIELAADDGTRWGIRSGPFDDNGNHRFQMPQDKGRLRAFVLNKENVREEELTELREPLDVQEYGAWIYPDKTIEQVGEYGHMGHMMRTFGISSYGEAFKEGYVRVETDYNPQLNLEGTKAALVNTFGRWWPTASHERTDMVRISVVPDSGERHASVNVIFQMQDDPEAKRKLREFIRTPDAENVQEQQLNELRELIDVSNYGGWIAADKEITYVPYQQHITLANAMSDNLGYPRAYHYMFDNGYIRFITENENSIGVEGYEEDIKALRGVWMPTAKQSDHLRISVKERGDPYAGNSFSYRLPEENKEMIAWISSIGKDTPVQEQQLNELRELIHREEYGGWIYPDKTVRHVAKFGHHDAIFADYQSYEGAFANKLIRFESDDDTHLILEGHFDAIAALTPIWWGTAASLDTRVVTINTVDSVTNDRYNKAHKDFFMPDDKAKMRAFVKGPDPHAKPDATADTELDVSGINFQEDHDGEGKSNLERDMERGFTKEKFASIVGVDEDFMSEVEPSLQRKTDYPHHKPSGKRGRSDMISPSDPFYGRQMFGGNKGLLVAQYKRLSKVVQAFDKLNDKEPVEKEMRKRVGDQIIKIASQLRHLEVTECFKQYNQLHENLYKLDNENVGKSHVYVAGMGIYSIESLMASVRGKLKELVKVTTGVHPYSWRRAKGFMDKGTLQLMMDSLIEAFDDLEKVRRKGGRGSRGISKDYSDI